MALVALVLLGFIVFSTACVAGGQLFLERQINRHANGRTAEAKVIYWTHVRWAPLVGTVTLISSFGLFGLLNLFGNTFLGAGFSLSIGPAIASYFASAALYFLPITALAYVTASSISVIVGLVASVLHLKKHPNCAWIPVSVAAFLGTLAALITLITMLNHQSAKASNFEQILWLTSWAVTAFLVFLVPSLFCVWKVERSLACER